MVFKEILYIQKVIIEKKPDWYIQIHDPSILKKYKEDFKYHIQHESRLEEAILGLKQLLQDKIKLKQKYENPMVFTKEKLPSTFFDEIQLARKNNLPLISDALIRPPPIQEKLILEKEIYRLLEQSKTQPNFWDPDFDFGATRLICDDCNEDIRGRSFYADIHISNKHEEESPVEVCLGVKIYCERCSQEATSPLIKVQFSTHIVSWIEDNIFKLLLEENPPSKETMRCLSSDNLIPQALHEAFVKEINQVAKNSKNDVHPGSEGKVINLIHPSMFPVKIDASKLRLEQKKQMEDPWNVSYMDEDRILDYQWLPTDVSIDKEGNCKFMSYINNLFRTVYPNLYPLLESILSCFIPLFEKSLKKDLKQKQIQVIVQAVDYILEPGQSYEENWQFHGIPQENIVAAGIYYYEGTKDMVDDGLEFRRQEHEGLNSMSTFDSDFLYWGGDLLGKLFSVFNSIETVIEKKIERCNFPEDLVSAFFDRNPESLDLFTYVDRLLGHFVQNTPIGHVETQPGRCIVFPNVFQHKMKGMHSPTSTTQQQKQRLLYFFLVDPDRPIPSTLSIKPQQKGYYTNLYFDLLKNVKMKGELLPLQIIHHILNYLVSDLSLEEALELRVKCMHERGLISDRRTRAFENKYRLNSYQ